MIYKNKNLTEQINRMAQATGTENVLSRVRQAKLEKEKKLGIKKTDTGNIITRLANKVTGNVNNKLDIVNKNLQDKQDGIKPEPTKLNNPSNVKVRDELYKDMKLKELQKLALTDKNAKKFMLTNKLGV